MNEYEEEAEAASNEAARFARASAIHDWMRDKGWVAPGNPVDLPLYACSPSYQAELLALC